MTEVTSDVDAEERTPPDEAMLAELHRLLAGARRQQTQLRESLLAVVRFLDRDVPG